MTPQSKKTDSRPRIGRPQIQLLERLCNACAVSGDEREVRSIVLEQVRPLADEVKVDALGNVLAIRRGQGENKLRVMLAAHMDEVGFMLTEDEGGGIFRFEPVGGIDARWLAGKPVWVGREHIPGVIGTKPIHMTTSEERSQVINVDNLRIDIGFETGVKAQVGDRATFATRFTQFGPSLCAKALDDRLGVTTLIELLRHAQPGIDLMAAFTVQEEVGLRGARVVGYTFAPQLALVLDCTPARDLPLWQTGSAESTENFLYNSRLDSGPAIYLADGATLSDPRLARFLIETAKKEGIPYQIRQPGSGGTDAGAIHTQLDGIPSVSISVPSRYPHSATGLARLSDWKNLLALVHAALSRLTPAILASER